MRGHCFFPPALEYYRGRRFMSGIINVPMIGTENDEEMLLSNGVPEMEGKMWYREDI